MHAVAREAVEAFDRLGTARVEGAGDATDRREALEALRRAAAWDAVRLEGERARFLEVYRPLGVLPPDRYRSLILQATTGCAWGGCSFCSLYDGERYRVRPEAEFRDHVRGVRRLLGRAIELRRGVFLAEANALGVDQEALVRLLGVIREELSDRVLLRREGEAAEGGGIASFQDAFTGEEKSVDDYAELARLGLRRVFLGVESGDDGVLRFLRKPATASAIARRVARLAEAGLELGVILLAGAGGRTWSERHVAESIRLVRDLPLRRRDVVYLSPLVADAGSGWSRRAREAGVEPLDEASLRGEMRAMREALRGRGLKVAPYDVRSFVYY